MQYELEYVCRHMLDNADMQLDLSAYPDVVLEFVVFGSVDGKFWGVKFECIGSLNFAIQNESDISKNDLHLVLGASVKSIDLNDCKRNHGLNLPAGFEEDRIWSISIEGHAAIQLLCLEFNWTLQELDPQTYEQRYA